MIWQPLPPSVPTLMRSPRNRSTRPLPASRRWTIFEFNRWLHTYSMLASTTSRRGACTAQAHPAAVQPAALRVLHSIAKRGLRFAWLVGCAAGFTPSNPSQLVVAKLGRGLHSPKGRITRNNPSAVLVGMTTDLALRRPRCS